MPTLRRILCPVDFSECSNHSLDFAAVVAREYSASITILHVVPPVISVIPAEAPFPTAFEEAAASLERQRLHTTAFVEERCPGLPVDSVVSEGRVADEIARCAATLRADLIVIGTHGRSGFNRLVLGSITETVIRQAPCAVITVPPHIADPQRVGSPVFAEVLWATNLTATCHRALEAARSLILRPDTSLTGVHVVAGDPVRKPMFAAGAGRGHAQRGRAAAKRPETVVESQARLDVVVAVGEPAPEIVNRARKLRTDLIVMGTGSTTNHVIREATCPVFSINP